MTSKGNSKIPQHKIKQKKLSTATNKKKMVIVENHVMTTPKIELKQNDVSTVK